MTKRIYSVSIRWVETSMDVKMIDKALDQLDDWLRLDGYQWFCATELDVREIHAIIAPLLKSEDSFVIAAIDPNAVWGHASNTIWGWFQKNGSNIRPKKLK